MTSRTTTSPAPQRTILDTIFWEVILSQCASINTRWAKITRLHQAVKSNALVTNRDGALSLLKADLVMLDHDLNIYRDILNRTIITDMTVVYIL